MMRRIGVVLAIGAAVALALPGLANADEYKKGPRKSQAGTSADLYYGKDGSGPRRFRRVGGYSFGRAEVTGAPPSVTAQRLWRPDAPLQSPSGPFDYGFFFDSGIQARGGNSPYQN